MFDDRSPIYRQIADRLRDDIVTGAVQAGDRVMSTNEYATFHRINPATANKALNQLVDEGLLEKRRGLGMFVTARARGQLLEARRARFVSDVIEPMVTEAERLGIGANELVSAVKDAVKAGGTSA